jgi:hypothetical protein
MRPRRVHATENLPPSAHLSTFGTALRTPASGRQSNGDLRTPLATCVGKKKPRRSGNLERRCVLAVRVLAGVPRDRIDLAENIDSDMSAPLPDGECEAPRLKRLRNALPESDAAQLNRDTAVERFE